MEQEQRLIRRKSLYRSLRARGLSGDDSETKGVNDSLYGEMRQFSSNPNRYSEQQLAQLADKWFKKALQVYNDPELSFAPPSGWRDFILNVKKMSLEPRRMGLENSANIIKQALSRFATELTAIDAN